MAAAPYPAYNTGLFIVGRISVSAIRQCDAVSRCGLFAGWRLRLIRPTTPAKSRWPSGNG